MLETTEGVVLRILEKPQLWLDPAFKQISEFITIIGTDKVTFPHSERTNTVGAINDNDGLVLCNDFVTGVYNRTIMSEADYSSSNIILQVLNLDCRHKTYFCTVMKQSIIINYISFYAVDSGGNLVSVKLASQKHGIFESGLLENGSIINLSKFQVIYFEYDEVSNLEPTNLMILALDLKIVGKKDQFFSEKTLKKNRLTIQ